MCVCVCACVSASACTCKWVCLTPKSVFFFSEVFIPAAQVILTSRNKKRNEAFNESSSLICLLIFGTLELTWLCFTALSSIHPLKKHFDVAFFPPYFKNHNKNVFLFYFTLSSLPVIVLAFSQRCRQFSSSPPPRAAPLPFYPLEVTVWHFQFEPRNIKMRLVRFLQPFLIGLSLRYKTQSYVWVFHIQQLYSPPKR